MEPPYSLARAAKGSFLSSLIRFRAVGVTDAVGEEEVRDSCDEGEVIDIKGEAELPSGTLMSRFSSSLLRRDTEMDFVLSMVGTRGKAVAVLLPAVVLNKCSCTGISA